MGKRIKEENKHRKKSRLKGGTLPKIILTSGPATPQIIWARKTATIALFLFVILVS